MSDAKSDHYSPVATIVFGAVVGAILGTLLIAAVNVFWLEGSLVPAVAFGLLSGGIYAAIAVAIEAFNATVERERHRDKG